MTHHVTIAEIDEQRTKGWTDFHPETYSSWVTDTDRFNTALGPPHNHPHNGIVCPGCFVDLHEQATGLMCTWRLVPDTRFIPVDNTPAPDGTFTSDIDDPSPHIRSIA